MAKSKTKFYIFGQLGVDLYESDGVDGIVEDLEDNLMTDQDFEIAKFSSMTTPDEVLEAFLGWSTYCEIAEEDYKKLFKRRDQI